MSRLNLSLRASAWTVALASAGLLAAAAPRAARAQAEPAGASVFLSARDCSQVTAAQACDGNGPGQGRYATTDHVGTGTTDGTLSTPSGSTAYARVGLDGDSLPEFSASVASSSTDRILTTSQGYRTYVYTGATATSLSYLATLQVEDASDNGLGVGGFAYPDGSGASGAVTVWDAADFPTDAADLLNPAGSLLNYGCGSAGVLGEADLNPSAPGPGTSTASVQSCSGSPLMIAPGERIVIAGYTQVGANRGGFVDATLQISGTDLVAVSAAPEPSAWALLLAGVGLSGFALRLGRRRGWAMA